MKIFGFGSDAVEAQTPPKQSLAARSGVAGDKTLRSYGSSSHGVKHEASTAPAVELSLESAAVRTADSPEQRLIEKLEDVPTSQGLLTVGARAIFKMPRELETALVVIERGPKRAAILYDPDAKRAVQIKAQMPSLRAKLVGEGYSIEKGEYPCRAAILKSIVESYLARQGSDGNDSANVASRSKTLFLGWLEVAVREGATDLHIEIKNDSAFVYLRVDGELERLKDEAGGCYTALEGTNAMAYPFNSLTNKGTNSSANWSKDQNLYCMTEPRAVGGKQISLRYQGLKGYSGPKVICRLLNTDPNAVTLTYAQLGYSPDQRQTMLDVANIPSGFVLFAGVTGSGKTTSLKTFIETHPGNGSMAIYSIEDPVEYPLKGVHQIVIQRDVSDKSGSMRAYQEVVASLMRADPDIVSIGEIRDTAGASAGQSIVETGHMALGTVHAHLITGIIPRLTNEEVGMSRDVLTNPNMLSLLAYQALVPKLCQFCRFDFKGMLSDLQARASSGASQDNEEHHIGEILDLSESRFGIAREKLRFRNMSGCSKCGDRGTKGLTVVAEMVVPDRKWLSYTRESKDYEAMVHYRSFSDGKYDNNNMVGKTVFEHTLYKAQMGEVDPRNCERFQGFKQFELTAHLGNSKQ